MLRNYIKIAWKVLRRNPFFTFVSLFGISLTIGIILILSALFEQLVGKHYPENPSGQTLMVANVNLNDGKGGNFTGGPGYHLIQNYILKMKSPKRVAYSTQGSIINSFVDNKKLSLTQKKTCEEFWKVNQFAFLEGKPYTKNHIEDNARVAVISRDARDDYFGEGIPAVGKFLKIDNIPFRVLGVVENTSQTQMVLSGDIFTPFGRNEASGYNKSFIGGFYTFLEGESAADLDKIREEYQSVVAKISLELEKNPERERYTQMSSHAVNNLERVSYLFSSNNKKPEVGTLYLILGLPMLLFMLLPALNLVNLNFSNIMERFSEIGVRKAFGATSLNLSIQFIVENIIVTLIGGAIGLIIALLGLMIIESSGVIKHADLGISLPIFLFAILICVFFGILSGVLPAWRMSKVQVVNALNEIHT